MKNKDRIIVSAVIISQDNKMLLGKVRVSGVYPDCWHIPGGGIEPDESKQDALTREIKEETGIDISNYEAELLSDSDTDEALKTDKDIGEKFLVTMHFNVFKINLELIADEVNISLNDDLVEYQWVPLLDLKKYKLTPPSEKLFRKLGWI